MPGGCTISVPTPWSVKISRRSECAIRPSTMCTFRTPARSAATDMAVPLPLRVLWEVRPEDQKGRALEKEWEHADQKLKQLRAAGREAAEDVNAATRVVLDEIRSGYEKLKGML